MEVLVSVMNVKFEGDGDAGKKEGRRWKECALNPRTFVTVFSSVGQNVKKRQV